ncbi:MAG: hypothetical protein WA949_06580 [Phormidesmis sp.]
MKRILLSLALFPCLLPASARAASTQTLACEASIPTGNGTALIYRRRCLFPPVPSIG